MTATAHEDAAPVAAIDCGTNSIRLLIARPLPDGQLEDLERRMEIVRLGYGVDRTGRFDPVAIDRTLDAARRYAELIRHHGARRIRFVATSATRDASNREDFIGPVTEILGVAPEVISGDEEAALSFSGAVSTLPDLGPGRRLVVDIGGGSTEFVIGHDAPDASISIDIGSVRITERHLPDDPPTEQEIAAATADIDAQLDGIDARIDLGSVAALVGVAGTVTTVTAVAEGVAEYSPDATHAARLPVERSLEVCGMLLRETREQRRRHTCIHPGRIDVIGAGALIWARVLERLRERAGITASWTSEHDILDGIALSILGR